MADPTPRTTPTRDEAVLNAADQMRRAIESADPAPVAQIVEWRLLLLDMKEALMWATYSNSALRGRVEAAEAALSAPAPADGQKENPTAEAMGCPEITAQSQLRAAGWMRSAEDSASGSAGKSGGVDAVAVKALEWEPLQPGWTNCKADSVFGPYYAGYGYWKRHDSESNLGVSNLDAAKAAAQADYEARISSALSPAATPVSCTYCGDTKTITDRVDGEITCPECGYEKRAATPVSEAGGRTGAEMIARHRFRLDADNNTAEIDSNGLAEEIDAALAKPAPSPALQPDAVSEPLAPQPPGCSGGDVHSDLVKRLNALVAKPGRDWRTGDEFIHGVHSQDIVDIIREASAALSPATVGRGALRSRG